jgi:uncharacterized damage-inducible protein DinB
MPADKLDWKPEETSRSALSQLQEIAMAPPFFLRVIRDGSDFKFDDHAQAQMEEMKKKFSDLDSCRSAAMSGTGELCQAISEFPDDRLDEEVTLPFAGGMVMSMADFLGLHQWNMVYHYGQVCYLQTMLGMMDMP